MSPVTLDTERAAHVSAAFLPENVAFVCSDDDVARVAAAGTRGAFVLAGAAVALLVALWLAFYVLVFLPRGAIG